MRTHVRTLRLLLSVLKYLLLMVFLSPVASSTSSNRIDLWQQETATSTPLCLRTKKHGKVEEHLDTWPTSLSRGNPYLKQWLYQSPAYSNDVPHYGHPWLQSSLWSGGFRLGLSVFGFAPQLEFDLCRRNHHAQ